MPVIRPQTQSIFSKISLALFEPETQGLCPWVPESPSLLIEFRGLAPPPPQSHRPCSPAGAAPAGFQFSVLGFREPRGSLRNPTWPQRRPRQPPSGALTTPCSPWAAPAPASTLPGAPTTAGQRGRPRRPPTQTHQEKRLRATCWPSHHSGQGPVAEFCRGAAHTPRGTRGLQNTAPPARPPRGRSWEGAQVLPGAGQRPGHALQPVSGRCVVSPHPADHAGPSVPSGPGRHMGRRHRRWALPLPGALRGSASGA